MSSTRRHVTILIIGSGIAGCTAALTLADAGRDVLLINAGPDLDDGNTPLAQGGIIYKAADTPRDAEARALEHDILVAGHRYNNNRAVRFLCRQGPDCVDNMLIERAGVDFDRNEDGTHNLTREGGHGAHRILHKADYSGRALMDGLDGKVARLTNTASEFGIQYDSLADLVAFGVAPAFTSWMWVLEGYGKLGIGVAFLYVACTALRLARFNVCVTTVSKKFFVGLPCPAAGCAVAMFILFSSYLPSWLEARTPFLGLVVTFVMALLMVSRVRYFSFKEYGFLKTHAFSSMISALLVFVLILSQPVVFGFLLGAIYLLSGPIYTYIILPRRNRQLLGSLTQN